MTRYTVEKLVNEITHHYIWYRTYVAQDRDAVTVASEQGMVTGLLKALRMIDKDAYSRAREIMREIDQDYAENTVK